MKQYLDLMRLIRDTGVQKEDRTEVGTKSIFGYQLRFNLQEGFPLLTTKRLYWKAIVEELLWFLRGDTNVSSLQERGVTIWDEWADNNGNLGPVYGYQWRSWPTSDGRHIDQISEVLKMLRDNPNSRRHIVSAWNVAQLGEMALPPCHLLYQFYVANGVLSCQMYQRSADVLLGLPFNIASYALLTMMVAQVTGYTPHEFIITLGDTHLYLNHMEQVETQLAREPKVLPRVILNPDVNDLFAFTSEDIWLENYDPYPRISAPIAV